MKLLELFVTCSSSIFLWEVLKRWLPRPFWETFIDRCLATVDVWFPPKWRPPASPHQDREAEPKE